MVEAGVAPRFRPSSTSIASQFRDNTKPITIRAGLLLHAVTKFKSLQPIRIHSQFHQCPSTYSSRMSTDIPFYETPGASFDQYLEDKPRVFTAIFPDKRRSQQLNEEEWRVHMLPIQFFFLTVSPVVDMRLRCKTNGKDYPSGISPAISKVLELDIIRWELQGLDNVVPPDHFSLGVQGALYSDRRGTRSRLKGQLEMKISVVTPPVLVLVPEDVRRSVSESVLKRLLENMKDKVNGNLLADYSKFRRER
ncbi:uncharacterized protein LOC130801896 isoform X1 [Amaranthus tricolor]|uniref:uncharacterized protein LOC130801896 isoform X1 n=1 Tax=Amaranthus tricolor TaxID=29722 RepID=UPI00258C2475|nr:uncharacterized protein LOC130801896 isoform X1 [Amaranthus tricolor]